MYLCDVVDFSSKFGFSWAFKDKTAETVLKCLKDLINKPSGKPLCIKSDNGGEFRAEII